MPIFDSKVRFIQHQYTMVKVLGFILYLFLTFFVFPANTEANEGNAIIHDLALLKDDYKNFYLDRGNLTRLAIGIGGAGLLANTSMDGDIQEFYQDNVRGNTTDDISNIGKIPGETLITVPLLIGTRLLFRKTQTGEWAQRSLRALFVGAPAGLILQRLTGSSRPSGDDSKWRPFKNSNGLSGHAFIGAVPFITAAKMNDNPYIKGILYGFSVLPGLSRINDNKHYFSQAAIGWYLALLSCNSIERTGKPKETAFTIIPISHGGILITVNRSF